MRLLPCKAWLVGSVVLVVAVVAPNGFGQSADTSQNSVQCELAVENSKWTKDADTVVRVHLRNLADVPAELSVRPTLYLGTKQEKSGQPIFAYWGPLDLKADAPIAENQKPQTVQLDGKGEAEFVLHAAKLRWDRIISSMWPHHELFEFIPRGQYSIYLELNRTLKSNTVAVSIEPESK